MISDFRDYRLGSLANLRSGFAFKSKDWLQSGKPVIRIANIKTGRIDASGCAFVSDEMASQANEWWTRAGDVLLTMTGYVGEVALVRPGERFLINQRVGRFEIHRSDLLDNRYLYYILQDNAIRSQMEDLARGSAQPNLSARDLANLTIPLPPIATQRHIVETLAVLDERIDLLRAMSTTLESIAQAIFKSWFIHFDPVRAKAAEQEPPGMDAETAALFPGEFQDSELGPIPKGWRCLSLDDAVELNPRRDLAKGTVAPYLDMANTPLRGHRPKNVVERAMGSGVRFTNGDTLLARITPSLENGKTAFVDFLNDAQVGWGSTEFIVMKPKQPLPPFFGYILAREPAFRAFAVQTMTGSSGRQRVELRGLCEYKLAVPDSEVAKAFERLVEPMRARIALASDETHTLADLRDTLLPRLISGKLRIPEAEEIVEEAVS